MKNNTNKGITLIALVITIIVMLILVAVTISMAINGGLFQKAGEAVGETQNKIDEEQTLASGRVQIDGVWYASIDDYVNNKPEPTAVYAKLYDDGTLILSSTDYTDPTRTVSEDYGDVSNLTEYEFGDEAPRYVTGEYPGWMPNMLYAPNTTVTNVIVKDKIVPKKIDGWFACMKNVERLDLTNIDTSIITSMNYLFSGCSSLTDLNISNWDTSNVTSMKYTFGYWASGPSQILESLTRLDISSFNTSNVTDFTGMFAFCWSLTELDVSNLDTSSAIYMGEMFSYCWGLTNLDVSSFDTSNVTNMARMFDTCKALTSLDLTNFNTQNITSYTSMFYNVAAPVYIGSNWNSAMTESATGYSGTFQTK